MRERQDLHRADGLHEQFCSVTSKKCVADHCQDQTKDSDEADTDCGGATCAKCQAGKSCFQASDCAAGLACHLGVCTDQSVPSLGLVGYWPLESGPAVADVSGNNNGGTVAGTVTFGTGKVGNGGTFANGCVAIKSSASLELVGVSSFSVMAWVKYGGSCSADNCTMWNKENQYEFAVGGSGYPANSFNEAVQTTNFPGWFWTASAAGVLTTGTWKHVAMVWNNVSVTRFVDGVALVDASNPRTFSDGAGFAARNTGAGIGCRNVAGDGSTGGIGSFFNGSIDEVAVYSRALSAGEIKAYYDATK